MLNSIRSLPYPSAASLIAVCLLFLLPSCGWFGPTANELVEGRERVVASIDLRQPTRSTLLDDVHHVTLKIHDPESFLAEMLAFDIPAGQRLLLTLEPWGGGSNSYANNPLRDILAGEYDGVWRTVGAYFREWEVAPLLRFAPEMEVPAAAFPWQQFPSLYIDAYRYVVEAVRATGSEIAFVWAPAGYPGAMEYFPGEDVVDVHSVVIHPASEGELTAYPKIEDPITDLWRRALRLRFAPREVLVLTDDREALEPDRYETLVDSLEGTRGLWSIKADAPQARGFDPIRFGLYDRSGELLHHPYVSVEHLFVDFTDLSSGRAERRIREAAQRGHDLIVTFEPARAHGEASDTNVLNNVADGLYDAPLNALKALLSAVDRRVYLRYAHEMEIPIHRYAWQSKDPVEYIRSFRYFMEYFADLSHVATVWGPAGDRGSLEWYPGDEWVDYLSIAIYGLPDKNITDPNKQEQFSTIFNRKTWRLRFVDKPLFVTEFGVKGPEDYQRDWLLAAAETLREAEGVYGINYFNMQDSPEVWGDIEAPDWKISEGTMGAFVEALRR